MVRGVHMLLFWNVLFWLAMARGKAAWKACALDCECSPEKEACYSSPWGQARHASTHGFKLEGGFSCSLRLGSADQPAWVAYRCRCRTCLREG
jgi:hypothetical protein